MVTTRNAEEWTMSQSYTASRQPRRPQREEEQQSALSYWGTGLACLSFLMVIFWLAGLKF